MRHIRHWMVPLFAFLAILVTSVVVGQALPVMLSLAAGVALAALISAGWAS